jgi:hypothetical protein
LALSEKKYLSPHEKVMRKKRYLTFSLSTHQHISISANCDKILIIIMAVSISPTSRDSKSLLKS